MYKLILVCLALVAVASAQYIASPYAYSGLYRSAYAGVPTYSAYSTGYGAAPLAYSGYGYGAYPGAYLYK